MIIMVKKASTLWTVGILLIIILTIGVSSFIFTNHSNSPATPAASQNTSVLYKNTEYGFTFTLPLSWNGYTIVTTKWNGTALEESKDQGVSLSGPIISIRHPLWTPKNPRQDIPIMIFTTAQWNSLQQGKFHIGAAPINPSELGRNSKYVFALPARYNFAFPTGFEEVENILNNKPLHPTEK